jgi:hypothetical protein
MLKPQLGLVTDTFAGAKGGMPAVIQAMRLSADPAARSCLKQYDAVSEHDRKVVPFEAYAIAAGLERVA